MPIFQTSYVLSFSESDSAGIMYFSRAYEIAHKAYEEMFSEKGSWELVFNNPDMAFPIIHSEASYKKPIKAGQTLELELSCSKLGSTSFTIDTIASFGENEVFRTKISSVCIEKESFEKHSLPDFIKKALGSK